MSDQITYPNCGITFLQEFLPQFFKNVDLLEGQKFKNRAGKIKAIQLLHYLSTSTDNFVEQSELTIFKLLVDIPQRDQIAFPEKLTAEEIVQCNQLLNAIIGHWSVLKNTSIIGVQEAFIQRIGLISKIENKTDIYLEQKGIDILLNQCPFNFSTVQLPWLKDILWVNI